MPIEVIVNMDKTDKLNLDADTVTYEFPDGTSDDEITAAIDGDFTEMNRLKAERMRGDKNDFRAAVRQRESSNRYDVVNSRGYLGGYQFGNGVLHDLGYTAIRSLDNSDIEGNFTAKAGVTNIQEFLKNPELQDKIFDESVELRKKRLERWGGWDFIGQEIEGIPVTESGLVAAAHLVGEKAVSQGLKGIENPHEVVDGNGVSFLEYLDLFKDYDLQLTN